MELNCLLQAPAALLPYKFDKILGPRIGRDLFVKKMSRCEIWGFQGGEYLSYLECYGVVVVGYERFGGPCCFHLQAAWPSETLVNLSHHSTLSQPEDAPCHGDKGPT